VGARGRTWPVDHGLDVGNVIVVREHLDAFRRLPLEVLQLLGDALEHVGRKVLRRRLRTLGARCERATKGVRPGDWMRMAPFVGGRLPWLWRCTRVEGEWVDKDCCSRRTASAGSGDAHVSRPHQAAPGGARAVKRQSLSAASAHSLTCVTSSLPRPPRFVVGGVSIVLDRQPHFLLNGLLFLYSLRPLLCPFRRPVRWTTTSSRASSSASSSASFTVSSSSPSCASSLASPTASSCLCPVLHPLCPLRSRRRPLRCPLCRPSSLHTVCCAVR